MPTPAKKRGRTAPKAAPPKKSARVARKTTALEPVPEEPTLALSERDVSRVAQEVVRLMGTASVGDQQTTQAVPPPLSSPVDLDLGSGPTSGDDADSFASSLAAALAAQGEVSHRTVTQAPMPTLTSPLGIDLTDKLRNKIFNEEYINLWDLLKPLDVQPYTIQVTPGTTSAQPYISLGNNSKQREVTNIKQWTDAFIIYTAVLTQKFPTLAPQLMKYMAIIRAMEATYSGYAWRTYDQRFRLIKTKMSLPWETIFWPEYLEASNRLSTPSTQGNRPFRGSPATSAAPAFPKGFCFAYQRVGQCNSRQCRHRHECHKCGGKHAVSTCGKDGAKRQKH